MIDAIEKLKAEIIADYESWQNKSKSGRTEIQAKMLDEFINGLRIEIGNKYIKVVSGTSVWGFIVNTHKHPKFKVGDILKAASWKAPAMNQARGNIVNGDFSWVKWTGPRYL